MSRFRAGAFLALSRQAIAVLNELHEFTGRSKFMFPGEGKKGLRETKTPRFGSAVMAFSLSSSSLACSPESNALEAEPTQLGSR